MELRHLRAFVVAAQEMHFGRAAERLGITTPSLSQLIKALEIELGGNLFNRNRDKTVSLTVAGRHFLTHARATVQQFDETKTAGREAASGHLGRIEIGYVILAACAGILQKTIAAYRETHPSIEVSLRRENTSDQLELLVSRRIDIGIFRRPHEYLPGLTGFVFHEEPLNVALPGNHKLTRFKTISAEALADEVFVAPRFDTEGTLKAHIKSVAELGRFTPRVVQRGTDAVSNLVLIGSGRGLAIVASSFATLRMPNVEFRPIEKLETLATLAAVYRSEERAAAVHAFLKLLRRRPASSAKGAARTL
jgi:DNA-binding transcriptional LysR family regulator